MTLVTIDCDDLRMIRYECCETHFRATHQAIPNDGYELTSTLVEAFRVSPPSAFLIEAGDSPCDSPPQSG